MYAIVEINGQQFKAEEGKKLFVAHIQAAEANQTVEFEKVLLVDNDGFLRSEHSAGKRRECIGLPQEAPQRSSKT